MRPACNPVAISIGLLTAVVPTIWLFQSLNLLFPVPFVIGVGATLVGFLPMTFRARKKVSAAVLVVCAVAWIGPFALRAYGERSGKPIEIVVPLGYKGVFSVVKDARRGQELEFHDGAWV